MEFREMTLPSKALTHVYDKALLFRMPYTGENKGYVYYLPRGTVKNESIFNIFEGKEDIKLTLPKDMTINLHNPATGEKKDFTLDEFSKATRDATNFDYDLLAIRKILGHPFGGKDDIQER